MYIVNSFFHFSCIHFVSMCYYVNMEVIFLGLGENIKKIRLKKNLTQQQLADNIGLKAITIRKYENNEREPNIETLQKIADTLNVSFSELVPKDDLQLASDYFRLKVLAEERGLIKSHSDHVLTDYFNSIKNPKRFILQNSFSVDVESLTDNQIDELFMSIDFAIKVKLEEFKNNKVGE